MAEVRPIFARRGLNIREVSLVKRGANQLADIKLIKSDTMEGDEPMLFEEIMAKLSDEEKAVVMAEVSKSMSDQNSVIDSLEKSVKELQDKIENLEKAEPVEETPTGIEAVLEKMEGEEAEELRKMFDRVRELEAKEELAKYEADVEEFENLPMKKEELAPMMKALDEADESFKEKMISILKSAHEAIGKMMEEDGTTLEDETDDLEKEADESHDKLEKMAKELVEKEDIPMSQALMRVYRENPELYAKTL